MRIKNKAILGLICLASFVITLVPTVLLPNYNLSAQSSEVCYFITPSGNRIDLSKLCGNGASTPASAPNSAPASRSNVVQAKIKQREGMRSNSQIVSSTPRLEVVVNNKHTVEMYLNTEGKGTLISEKLAKEWGIVPRGTTKIMAGDGSILEFPAGYLDSLSIGGRVLNNVEVAILEGESVGSLGPDVFGDNYFVRIKPDVVEFYPRG
jgi:aspartyl protease family protein